MTTPVRMRLSRAKGFNLQAASRAINGLPAVSVARPGKWGNPFVIGGFYLRGDPDPKRAGPVRMTWVRALDPMFADARYTRIETAEQAVDWFRWYAEQYPNVFSQLRNHNIACWCPLPAPGEPDHCHAAVLLEIANR